MKLWSPGPIFMFRSYITQFGGPAFEPCTHTHVSVGACLCVRLSRLSPARCNSVALAFKQQESESNLGPPGQFSRFVYKNPNPNQSLGISPSTPRHTPRYQLVPAYFTFSSEDRSQTCDPQATFDVSFI